MKNISKFKFLNNVVIILTLALLLLLPGYAYAAGNAAVSVSLLAAGVEREEQFTVSINIEPNNDIAGVQFDLSFNPDLVTIDSIIEGNLLSQDGASSFFNAGTIDNQSGTIAGVFSAIITPGQSVSSYGTVAVITMTAGTAEGNCPLTLSNVIVGDVISQPVPVTIINGTVTIGEVQEDPPPSNGGGGGGGGARGVTTFSSSVTPEGKFVTDITAMSSDLQVYLKMLNGSYCTYENGNPVYWISIKALDEMNTVPDPPEGWIPVTPAYEMEPAGVIFSPAAICTFKYGLWTLPEGINENKITIMQWDPMTVQWMPLETQVDTAEKMAIAPIEHFSLYQAMAPNQPASFVITELTVSPQLVEPGDDVNITATVANIGDIAGSYEVVLMINDGVLETQQITLDDGTNETLDFHASSSSAGIHQVCIGDNVVTFTVKEPEVPEVPEIPASFSTSNLRIYPATITPGENIGVDVIVSNTGGLSGSHDIFLRLNDKITQHQEVILSGSESETVHFNITLEDIGDHTINVDDLYAKCEVVQLMAPAEDISNTNFEINTFHVRPIYDSETGKLVSTRINYQINIPEEPSSETELTLKVFFNDQLIEQIPLFSLNQLQTGENTGSLGYAPSPGWELGTYAFQAELTDGSYIQSTSVPPLTITPEHITDVVSWKTLGIVIASTLISIVLIVTFVLYRRRAMLRDYFL